MKQFSYCTKIACTILFAASLVVSCSDKSPPTANRRNIQVKHDANPIGIVNPHAWATTTLVINGKEFKGVVGSEPFYLEITNRNAIAFVTREAATLSTIHIFDFDSNQALSVNLGAVSFGDAIGVNRTDDHDSIEVLETNHLAVASRFLHRKTVWHIDLPEKKVTRKEVFDHDQSGKITNHVVVPLSIP